MKKNYDTYGNINPASASVIKQYQEDLGRCLREYEHLLAAHAFLRGVDIKEVAEAAGVSTRTIYRWVKYAEDDALEII